MGHQQKANMATTTTTILVALFLPLLPSADTCPPGAAPVHKRTNIRRYKPQINANGIT